MILPGFVDHWLSRTLDEHGYALVRREHVQRASSRRKLLLSAAGVDLVIDVGANEGQYGLLMRKLEYAGRIVSFEPMREAYALLQAAAAKDGNWEARPVGLGDRAERQTLHVSENSVSSSLLDMLPLHRKAAPTSGFVAGQSIEITTLDQVFDEIAGSAQHVWLKLDVQGFEDRVLRGARASLPRVEFIQIELSTVPLYEGQTSGVELTEHLYGAGYRLVGLEPGFMDGETGELLQYDGIFRRVDSGEGSG